MKYKDKTYRLLNGRSGETFMLKTGRDGRLLFFDKEKGHERAIRHCPNERSIFLDEQSQYAIVEPIIFEQGYLDVPYQKKVTQDFLNAHPSNKNNGGSWFEEVDEVKEAEMDVEQEELILNIKQSIFKESKKEDGLHSLKAATAGIIGSLERVKNMSLSELKQLLYSYANSNPELFVNDKGEVTIFDDDKTQLKYITLSAIDSGILKKSSNGRAILWGHNKEVITNSPIGIDTIDYFSDFLTTDEGSIVLDEIKKRV